MFQAHNLFPHKTVLQNVIEGPLVVQKRPKDEVEAEAVELLEQVGLAEKRDQYPFQLSGGQQQRVGIARALALKPKVVLFDEPTSALDPELVGEVLSVIRDLAVEGWTLVIVTHEIQFARQVSDQVLFTDQGVILEKGPPAEVIGNPKRGRDSSGPNPQPVEFPRAGYTSACERSSTPFATASASDAGASVRRLR